MDLDFKVSYSNLRMCQKCDKLYESHDNISLCPDCRLEEAHYRL